MIKSLSKKFKWQNFVEDGLIRASGIITIVILLLIVIFLILNGFPFLLEYNFFDFLFKTDWYPLSQRYGALPLIYGSFLVTIMSTVIAVPLSLGTALFISQIAPPKVRTTLKVILEVLASIPSVVFGFLGIIILGPFLEGFFDARTGLNALNASILLALMSIPTITSIAEESLAAVPKNLKEGSLALGASKLQTMLKIILPAAQPGIIAGIMLGIGRAIGETMTVMMVAGGSAQITANLLDPVRTMTGTIASEMGEVIHGDEHYHALFILGLILFLITFGINSLSSFIIRRIQK